MQEWISAAEAATLLGISESTVYRSLADAEVRAAQWGAEGEGWRIKPLSRRKIYQVNRKRTEQLASGSS